MRRLPQAAGVLTALLLVPAALRAQGADLALGKRLFAGATPACALCHTLADAGAAGAIGPVLDELRPDAARVEKAIRNGIGQMPAYRNLSEREIAALARYVAGVAGR